MMGTSAPANSVERLYTTAGRSAASALPVKQSARISARSSSARKGNSKDNGAVKARRHYDAYHTIHWL